MDTSSGPYGTPPYMSPEQMLGKEATPQDDIYSFGMTMLELMPKNAPKSLRAIAERAASKDARRRFKSAGEVAKALEDWISSRRRKQRALAVLVAVLLAMGGTFYAVESRRITQERAVAVCLDGEDLLKDGREREAIRFFTRSIELRPTPRTYLFRGFCYWRLCDFKSALKDAESAIELDPSNQAAKDARAMAMDALDKGSHAAKRPLKE